MSQNDGSERKSEKLMLIGFADSFFQMKIAELGAFPSTECSISGRIAATESIFGHVVQIRAISAIHYFALFLILALFAQNLR